MLVGYIRVGTVAQCDKGVREILWTLTVRQSSLGGGLIECDNRAAPVSRPGDNDDEGWQMINQWCLTVA